MGGMTNTALDTVTDDLTSRHGYTHAGRTALPAATHLHTPTGVKVTVAGGVPGHGHVYVSAHTPWQDNAGRWHGQTHLGHADTADQVACLVAGNIR